MIEYSLTKLTFTLGLPEILGNSDVHDFMMMKIQCKKSFGPALFQVISEYFCDFRMSKF